jgi:hypothetical protein
MTHALSEAIYRAWLPHPFARFWRRVGSCRSLRTAGAPAHRRWALDFNRSLNAIRPRPKAAPLPVLWCRDQSALHRVLVDVAEFLHCLLSTPHRKLVIAGLPETRHPLRPQSAGGDLFEHLHHRRQFPALRLADQKVYMLRHNHVARDVVAVPAADTFQIMLERVSRANGIEQLHSPVTTERDEVQTFLTLVSDGLNVHSLECSPQSVTHPVAKSATRAGQPHFGTTSYFTNASPCGTAH